MRSIVLQDIKVIFLGGRSHCNYLRLGTSRVALALHYCLGLAHPLQTPVLRCCKVSFHIEAHIAHSRMVARFENWVPGSSSHEIVGDGKAHSGGSMDLCRLVWVVREKVYWVWGQRNVD